MKLIWLSNLFIVASLLQDSRAWVHHVYHEKSRVRTRTWDSSLSPKPWQGKIDPTTPLSYANDNQNEVDGLVDIAMVADSKSILCQLEEKFVVVEGAEEEMPKSGFSSLVVDMAKFVIDRLASLLTARDVVRKDSSDEKTLNSTKLYFAETVMVEKMEASTSVMVVEEVQIDASWDVSPGPRTIPFHSKSLNSQHYSQVPFFATRVAEASPMLSVTADTNEENRVSSLASRPERLSPPPMGNMLSFIDAVELARKEIMGFAKKDQWEGMAERVFRDAIVPTTQWKIGAFMERSGTILGLQTASQMAEDYATKLHTKNVKNKWEGMAEKVFRDVIVPTTKWTIGALMERSRTVLASQTASKIAEDYGTKNVKAAFIPRPPKTVPTASLFESQSRILSNSKEDPIVSPLNTATTATIVDIVQSRPTPVVLGSGIDFSEIDDVLSEVELALRIAEAATIH